MQFGRMEAVQTSPRSTVPEMLPRVLCKLPLALLSTLTLANRHTRGLFHGLVKAARSSSSAHAVATSTLPMSLWALQYHH